MDDALVARYAADTAFASQVDDAARRVLVAKDGQRLLSCSTG